jgi:hypothetical protein
MIEKLLQVPNNDFRMMEEIDPEEFDANNVAIVAKIDELVDETNQQEGQITALETTVAEHTNTISINETDIEAKVTTINNTLTALSSIIDSSSGADMIGATPVPGIVGDSVQEVLEGLKLAIDVTQLGQIVDGSITDVKLSDEAANIKARFTEHTIDHHEHVVNVDGLTGGTATAYTVAVPIWSGIAFPRHGMTQRIKAHISCGDNPTLKVGDWVALDIIKQPLSAYTRAMTGDIIDDCYYTFMYDTSPAAWIIVESKDADTVDGKHSTDFVLATDVVTAAEANKILKLNVDGKLPANITGDANTLDGNDSTAFAKVTGFTMTSGSANFADLEMLRPLIRDYAEKIGTTPATTGTCNFDLTTGNVFAVTPTGAITIGAINPPANGRGGSATIWLTNGATVYAKTFASSIKWVGDTIPDMSEASKTYGIVLTTLNGGTTYRAACIGAYSA